MIRNLTGRRTGARGISSAAATAGLALALALAFAADATAQQRRMLVEAPRVLEELSVVYAGSGSYLGVMIAEVGSEGAESTGADYGAFVSSVVEDGPAAAAGLQADDVIVSWNGERVEGITQLRRLLRETPPGRTAELGVVRGGSTMTIQVELGEPSERAATTVYATMERAPAAERQAREELQRVREEAVEEALSVRERHGVVQELRERLLDEQGDLRVMDLPVMFEGLDSLQHLVEGLGDRVSILAGDYALFAHTGWAAGVWAQRLGDQLAGHFGVEGGFLVTTVREQSPAAEAGLQAGDVIISIDGHDVTDRSGGSGWLVWRLTEEAEEDSREGGGNMEIRIVRDGAEHTVTIEVRSNEMRRGFWPPGGGAMNMRVPSLQFRTPGGLSRRPSLQLLPHVEAGIHRPRVLIRGRPPVVRVRAIGTR